MWNWISHLDPNAVLAVVVALGTYIYHRLAPPQTQSALDRTFDAVRTFARDIITQAAPGASADTIETAVRGFAAVQLAKIGFLGGAYTPLVSAAVDAVVHEAIQYLYEDQARLHIAAINAGTQPNAIRNAATLAPPPAPASSR